MKNIVLIMITISMIILSGCNQQDIFKFAEKAIENPQLCNSLDYSGTPFNSDVCYSFVAIRRQEIDLCENVIDTEAKKGCYYEVRRKIGFTDLSDCEEVPEFKPKSTCYESIAKGITDIEECNEFPEDYRYICYYEFVASTEDASIYDQYFSPLTEERIQEQLDDLEKQKEENIKLGRDSEEDYKKKNYDPYNFIVDRHSGCYDFVARRTINLDLCLSPGCMRFIAMKSNKPKICLDIENKNFVGIRDYDLEDEKNDCLASVLTQVSHENIELCSEITEEWQRNGCIKEIAVQTGNIKLCKNIQVSGKSTTTVTRCYIDNEGNEQCTEEEQQTSYLDKTEEYKIDNCYLHIAKDNPQKCDDVAEDSMKLRNACYYKISRVTNNPSICQNIVIPEIDDVTCEDYLNNHGLVATPER